MTGEQQLPLPREAVWTALNDVDMLKICIPGCESIRETSENKYEILMHAAIGPIKARFKGEMSKFNIDAPESYSMSFSGTGGAAGFARGEAHVKLAETDSDKTTLEYRCDAKIGGKLAQIGARLVDSAASMMATRFFEAFTKELRARAEQQNGSDSLDDSTEIEKKEDVRPGIFRKFLNAVKALFQKHK